MCHKSLTFDVAYHICWHDFVLCYVFYGNEKIDCLLERICFCTFPLIEYGPVRLPPFCAELIDKIIQKKKKTE